jgi:CHASE2 domain-containing sensor protein
MRRTLSRPQSGAAAGHRRHRRHRLVRLCLILAVALLLLGLAAALVGWVGTYLVPVVVILGVVVGSFGLLVWVASTLDDRWYTL